MQLTRSPTCRPRSRGASNQNGAPRGEAPRAQQTAFAGPGEVNQIVPVEMRDLRGRSAIQRLTPDVADPIGAHDEVKGLSIRTPGERCSRARRALKDCESPAAVCLHHGEKRTRVARVFPGEVDAGDLPSVRRNTRNRSRLLRDLDGRSAIDWHAPQGRLAADAGSPIGE